jgi:uncharacterized damage-inducible protein DinB
MGEPEADVLAARYRQSAERLIAVVEAIDAERWTRVPEPGVWSAGKEAEHVAEAMDYHQWVVRLSIGEPVSSRRPTLERRRMTTALSPAEIAAVVRDRMEIGARLIGGLSARQLALPTKPPRARAPSVADSIQGLLIDHIDAHCATILAKSH